MNTEQIQLALYSLGANNDVDILYAAESGSRMWGIDDEGSDYDVRFIDLEPIEFHVTAFKGARDVIEYKNGKLDMVGWELGKAVSLLAKYNTNLIEWLSSPIVYIEPDSTVKKLMWFCDGTISPASSAYHYYSLARNQYNRYVNPRYVTPMDFDKKYLTSMDSVSYKKYLYVLRGVMSALWCLNNDSLPPLNFMTLYSHTVKDDRAFANSTQELSTILARKRDGSLSDGGRMWYIEDYIDSSMKKIDLAIHGRESRKMSYEDRAELDIIYRDAVLGSLL
jgi:predicted nucleotidyltransferase